MNEKLTLKFELKTIQHLGLQMYSQIPAALAELVANAYDADASEVHIKLYDGDKKRIVVEDDGHGMSFDDINNKFLTIGRDRRDEENGNRTPKGRFVSGKKGLGKLALFGVGEVITIDTKPSTLKSIKFTLNWKKIKSHQGDYHPEISESLATDRLQGTTITISNLKRKTKFDQEAIATSIARLFNYIDDSFLISVSVNDEESTPVGKDLKFKGLDIQFEWKDFSFCKKEYERKKEIKGRILTTKKPLKPHLRGISLFANGRLVNSPQFFTSSESSHFYSYATGILNVDFMDEGHGDSDLITTNRQGLNWEDDATRKLKEYLDCLLQDIQKDWRSQRREVSENNAKPSKGFKFEEWYKSLPKEKAQVIKELLESEAEDNASIPLEDVVRTLHKIAPEYATLQWRYLNPHLQKESRVQSLYKEGHYHEALGEAIKCYISEVKNISNPTNKDITNLSLMETVFKEDKGNGSESRIKLTKGETQVEKDIENGHRDFSKGIVTGFRNPLSHELVNSLKEKSLITDKHCLDILSLVSHLFDRLDRRVAPPKPKK